MCRYSGMSLGKRIDRVMVNVCSEPERTCLFGGGRREGSVLAMGSREMSTGLLKVEEKSYAR